MNTTINYNEEIVRLKQERKALILAHYYQPMDIQEIADFVGDSYDLSVKAKQAKEDLIIFCGVSFMAETAKILSPHKTILHPNPNAGCPMANMVTPHDVAKLKLQYPNSEVVCYVNTYADVKAVSDVCVTSSSAVKIVNKLKSDTIIFVPDKNLADYVQHHTTKTIIPGEGFCYVHNKFTKENIVKSKQIYPNAKVIVHPECPPEVIEIADEAMSTSGMLSYVENSDADVFIIGTEYGLIEKLSRMYPQKKFFSAGNPSVCVNMKKIKLEDVYFSLLNNNYPVELSQEIIKSAQKSLERMIELNK